MNVCTCSDPRIQQGASGDLFCTRCGYWWSKRHGSRDPIKPAARNHAAQVITRPPIGRNAPCPCGSGKKFKKCCLTAVDERQNEQRRLLEVLG